MAVTNFTALTTNEKTVWSRDLMRRLQCGLLEKVPTV